MSELPSTGGKDRTDRGVIGKLVSNIRAKSLICGHAITCWISKFRSRTLSRSTILGTSDAYLPRQQLPS